MISFSMSFSVRLSFYLLASSMPNPSALCLLPRLPRVVLERVSCFAGVEVGQRVWNMRELKEAPETLDRKEFDDSDDY